MDRVEGEDAERDGVQRQDQGIRGSHRSALILLFACVALAPLLTDRFGVRGFVPVYAVSLLCWLAARSAPLSFRTVLLLAVALRALVFFADPMLSNDVFRYLWDGRVLASGINPYLFAPNDPALAPLRTAWHWRINHPEIRTIYPPHAELLFALFRNLFAWRLLLLIAEIALLFRLRNASYALCPLVVFEGVWHGHVDLLAGILVAFALCRTSSPACPRPQAAFRRPDKLESLSYTVAIGLKITPIAALPAFLRRRNVLLIAVTLILPALPFLGDPIMPGLREYALRWVFNSPLYDAFFHLVSRIPLKEWWTAIKDPLHLEPISDFVYHHVYADFVTRSILAVLAAVLILRVRRSVSLSIAALLFCAPAIHPWYWLAVLPAALIEGAAPVVALAVCAPFSYLLYAGAPPLAVYLLCYGLAAIAGPRLSATASSAAGWLSAALRFRRGRGTSRS